jgi:hypothetical protein
LTIDGVAQILLQSEAGTVSVAPVDGTLLSEHPWPVGIVQPALTADGNVLISSGSGMRRSAVARGPGGWTIEERWTSNRLKPDFNHFVVHDGHAFGFDGSILACIDLEDGARAVSGDRGQNLEPPSAGRRRSAGSQRPGDGRVPAVPRGRLTGVRVPSTVG